jgi:hypothetical protein
LQVVEASRCFNLRSRLAKELVADLLGNLYFDIEDAKDLQTDL